MPNQLPKGSVGHAFAAVLAQGPGTIAQWAALVGAYVTARYGASMGEAVQSAIIAGAGVVVAVVTHERHATARSRIHLQIAETNAAAAIANAKASKGEPV